MRLRVMTESDLASGVRLNTLAGWNQTAGDWSRFLARSPRGCFVVEDGTKVVGTATTVCYEDRFAWIGMVLVDPEYRKQGIGTQLLHAAIEHLQHRRIPTMKLDATPPGRPLYAKLGFVDEFSIERWVLSKSNKATTDRPSPDVRASPPHSRQPEIFRTDCRLFGADRSSLLRALGEEAPDFAMAIWRENRLEGYTFGRRGLFADHLGPWMAINQPAAESLLHEFIARSHRETLIVDCIKSNPFAAAALSTAGFAPARPLMRMFHGPNSFPGEPATLCGILGPEFG